MLLQTAVHASTMQAFFHVCSCQTSRASLLYTLSARCFAYFKQSGNHAHALVSHCEAPPTMI